MSGKWSLVRMVIIGVALVSVVILFSRQDVDPKLRFVLVLAAALYSVRLYLAATDARRRKRESQGDTT